jgi:pimeloyl-ACP methyl ester carboxylesterase
MSATPEERAVEIRDGAVSFRVLSAGSGAPLVHFHSFHDREPWSPFLERLAERFTVYAPVHPGAPGSHGVETLDDVHDLTLAYDELLDALGLPSPHLVGHFFGGMIAAELGAVVRHRWASPARAGATSRSPRAPGRIVLISPLGLWLDAAPPADVVILPLPELMTALWRDPASDVARRWAALPENEAESVEAQVGSIQRRAAMAKFVWPIPDKGLAKRLHRIAARTLILWGDEDRANPPAYAEEWTRRIAGSELRRMPGGHMLIHESPDPVAAAVTDFLGQRSMRSRGRR